MSLLLKKLDFTLDQYAALCSTIKMSKYQAVTVRDYLAGVQRDKYLIIMRHDVEEDARKALDMARVEHSYGIQATYYFRMKNKVYVPDIIDQIASYHHEIGYLYETLDKSNGDMEKAIMLFAVELAMLRERYDIKTACMHPLTEYDNKKIWENCKLAKFNLLGDPYFSMDYNQMLFLSDSGRTWLVDTNKVNDRTSSTLSPIDKVEHTTDLIDLINDGRYERICILTHPESWSKNIVDCLGFYLLGLALNAGKRLLSVYRGLFKGS